MLEDSESSSLNSALSANDWRDADMIISGILLVLSVEEVLKLSLDLLAGARSKWKLHEEAIIIVYGVRWRDYYEKQVVSTSSFFPRYVWLKFLWYR